MTLKTKNPFEDAQIIIKQKKVYVIYIADLRI